MDRVTVRQLRNDVSRILRRAQAGERLVITSNGKPVAELGPIVPINPPRTLEELIEAGLVIPPRTRARPRPARPIKFSGPLSTDEILRESRRDRL